MADGFYPKRLLILGAGQYGDVVKDIAECMGEYGKIDFLDDNSSKAIGRISEIDAWKSQYDQAIVAVGNPVKRLELTNQIRQIGMQVASIISPNAYISNSAKIAEGCVIEAFAVVNSNSVIGDCCLISAGAIINHNVVIGNGCHIDCNAVVGSNVTLKPSTKIAYGQIARNI